VARTAVADMLFLNPLSPTVNPGAMWSTNPQRGTV